MEANAATESASDLVERLAAHDIRYLVTGVELPASRGQRIPIHTPPPGPLAIDLAASADPRLRASLIALLLRHPEAAVEAEAAARKLGEPDEAFRLILVSIVVAAALQHNWSFLLGLYLGKLPKIRADHISLELGLPLPADDFGRPCVHRAADLLRGGAPFPYNFEGDWGNAARRLIDQLAREASVRGS